MNKRVEPTDEWEQIELLCGCPEQWDYELVRPLVLFGPHCSHTVRYSWPSLHT